MENIYYVYCLLDQRYPGLWKFEELEFKYKPFYFGKGKLNRIVSHFYDSQLKESNHKNNIIKKIKKETNELPLHYRIYENLSEESAFELEVSLIKYFGKVVDKSGILANLSDGGDGSTHPSKHHWIKVYQYDIEGNFVKEWENITIVAKSFGKNHVNISRNIKKDFLTFGYVWKYEYLGDKIEPYIKYKRPSIYQNIKKIDKNIGEIIKVYKNVIEITNEFNLNRKMGNKFIDCINGKSQTAYGFKWSL